MNINSIIKTTGYALAISFAPMCSTPTRAQKLTTDTFQYEVPASGTQTEAILENAPSPDIIIQEKMQTASIVIDLSKNILYKYDSLGNPKKAYLVASGAKGSPTEKYVQIVTHIETFPYKNAPHGTKRRRRPQDFGPKIICLNILNPQTGEQRQTGQFIHGNNNAESIGKYASHGCIRMDNEVIKQLSQEVKRGDIVIVK